MEGWMLEQLLGSRLRARAIGWLFTHPDERFYVRQLTDLLGEDSTNLSRELARLETIGILLVPNGTGSRSTTARILDRRCSKN